MGFTDFIKPKWKHSDPQVRRKAVARMDAVEDADRIREMAINDADEAVRAKAVGKIFSLTLLDDLRRNDAGFSVRQTAGKRRNRLLMDEIQKETDTATRIGLIRQMEDTDMLMRIIREVEEPDVRTAVVQMISDPELLCEIIRSHCGLKAGLAALEKLSDPEHLQRVAETASNRKVKKQARDRADAILRERNAPSPEARKDAALKELCEQMETEDFSSVSKAETRLAESKTAWDRLDPEGSHFLSPRFSDACHQAEVKLKERREYLACLGKAENLCLEMERLGNAADACSSDAIAEQIREWEDADFSRIPETEFLSIRERFEQGRERCEALIEKNREAAEIRLAENRALEELCRRAEACAELDPTDPEAPDWNALKQEWAAIAGKNSEMKQRFEAALSKWEDRKKTAEAEMKAAIAAQTERLTQLCETVESLVENEDRAGLDRKVRAAQEEWKRSGAAVPEFKMEIAPRFRKACEQFFSRQREYWEHIKWERWANLNQKKELCELAERFGESDETEGVAEIVREAQKKWKEIGPVSREQSEEIRERFSRACDRVFQRCLEAKREIFQQIKECVAPQTEMGPDTPPDQINWAETADQVKSLQARWNAVGALPLNIEKNIRQAYYDTCNAFFENRRAFYERMDAERRKNLEQKTEICEKAEALSGSEDWNRTASQLKELQRQWKEIGPVPKKEGDVVWMRFRSACDSFFHRLKACEPENLRIKEAFCEKAEALVSGSGDDENMDEISRELMALQKEWKKVGPVPADRVDDLWERFRKPCDEFFNRRKAFFKEKETEWRENREKKEALILRAEALAGSTDWRETGEQLKALQREWKEAGSASRKDEQILWEKFRSICDSFFSRRNAFFEQKAQDRNKNLEQKEYLCLSLEALARLVLPEKVLSDHEMTPAAEHLSLGLEFKEEIIVPGNLRETWDRVNRKVQEIQKEWKKIGPVPPSADERLWRRFRKAGDLFFTQRQKARTDRRHGENQEAENGSGSAAEPRNLSEAQSETGAYDSTETG